MNKQTISVGMTTYNSEKFVEEQLESIFSQSIKPDEIVICDDQSTDRTMAVITEFANRHTTIPIRIYENETNLGCLRNYEQCFMLCQGEIIIPCDSDDVWLDEKIRRIVEVFQSDEVVYAFHEISVTDEHLNVTKPYYYKGTSISSDYMDPEKIIIRDIQRKGIPNGMAIAFRRSLLKDIIPFYIEHDGWIDACAPLYGKVAFIPEVLAFYRRHTGNLSGHHRGTFYAALYHTKKDRFHMSPILLKGYNEYLERFNGRLSDKIIKELNERINFERALLRIVKESRIKAIILLLGLYNNGYQKYRGSWKLLCADLINVATHKE